MSKSPSLIRRFFQGVWTVFSVAYKLMIVLSVLVGVALLYMAFKGGAPVTVDDNVALIWHPTGAVVEQTDRDPTEELFSDLAGETPPQTELRDLVDALDYAADDSRIRMVVLWLDALAYAGPAQLEELRAAITRFKESGKRVVAYAPAYTQRGYYLAAQADEVLMDPMGIVFLEGYAVYNNYFPGLLDKLGINVHVFQAGEYKSAVEPYTRPDMSEAAREASVAWLGTLWSQYVDDVSAARGLEARAIEAYVNTYVDRLDAQDGDAAQVAREARLVDALLPLKEVREQIGNTVGMDESHGSFRQIDFRSYLKAVRKDNSGGKQVAVVTVQGAIVPGNSEEGTAGGDTISELLRDAADDDKIGAVVLRVNSPGGSIFPSEQIRRAVLDVQATGKPVVVSMSTLAASGGYWISAPADRIIAHETTITGSIGVFGLFPTFEDTLDKIGVTTDGVGTTPLAGAARADRPLDANIERAINLIIGHDYRKFVGLVAEGRGLTPEGVDAIAQGRVWSGLDALEIELVDAIGGFRDAVTAAAEAAGLDPDDVTVRHMRPASGSPFAFLGRFTQSLAQLPVLADWMGWLMAPSSALPTGAQAWSHMPTGNLRWLEASAGQRSVASHCFCTPVADTALISPVPGHASRL